MRIFLSNIRGEINAAVREIQRPMAEAATAALREVAEEAVAKGRQHLGTAGFGAKSQKGFTSKLYPKGGRVASLRGSARIYHKVGYFGVFERGAPISGKPKLWLPLDTVPKGPGGRQLRPREYAAKYGPLRSVNHAGRAPLLVGPPAGLSAFRKGTAQRSRSVPLFVGVSAVKLRDRLDLYGVIDRAADRFGEFYVRNVK